LVVVRIVAMITHSHNGANKASAASVCLRAPDCYKLMWWGLLKRTYVYKAWSVQGNRNFADTPAEPS